MFEKIKYESTLITFTEIPDEITFCLNISGCPCHCEGCFEPWLKDDIGLELTSAVLVSLIDAHPYITTVCFMGGDRYYVEMAELIDAASKKYPSLKWAMYSGREALPLFLLQRLDYAKIGPYIAKFGPLNKKTTNQRLLKKVDNNWEDITYKFQKESE